MILCDTNILIEFYKNNSKIIEELSCIGPNNLAISPITQAELYFGALKFKAELQSIKRHLALLSNFPLDIPISTRFVQLMENYSPSHNLNLPDALIAATALSHDVQLYTLNLKDFRFISGLKLHRPMT